MIFNVPVIPGIDWEKSHKYLENEAVLRDVLTEMVRTCDKQTTVLDMLRVKVLGDVTRENLDAYRIQAHAMKATIRSIGSDLFDMAFALETAGREGDVAKIRECTDEFIEEYRRLVDKLKAVVGECDTLRAFNKEEFIDKLEIIKNSMNAFDVRALQEAYRSIADMEIPKECKALVDKLEKAVRDLTADDVIMYCNELGNTI